MEKNIFMVSESTKIGFINRKVEINCEENYMEIKKYNVFFKNKIDDSKTFNHSDIKSMYYRYTVSIIKAGISISCILGAMFDFSIFWIIGAIVFGILALNKELVINDGDLRIKDNNVTDSDIIKLIPVLEEITNIKVEIWTTFDNLEHVGRKALLGMVIICGIIAGVNALLSGGFGDYKYTKIVGDYSINIFGQDLNTVSGFTSAYDTEWEEYVNENNEDIIHARVSVQDDWMEYVDLYFIVDGKDVLDSEIFINDKTVDRAFEEVINDALVSEMNPIDGMMYELGVALGNDMNDLYMGSSKDQYKEKEENNLDNYYESPNVTYDMKDEDFSGKFNPDNITDRDYPSDELYDEFLESKLYKNTKIKDTRLFKNSENFNLMYLCTTEKGYTVVVEFDYSFLPYKMKLLFSHEGEITISSFEQVGNTNFTQEDMVNELERMLSKS